MNKIELIDAIQQVITPNGKKAISAESLANLLIDIVSAIPEGGNGGSGQVVFYFGMPNEEFTEVTLTPEHKAHNAEMFKVVKESPIALSASLDCSEFNAAQIGEALGIDISCCKCCMPSVVTSYYTKDYTEAIGLSGDLVVCEADGLTVSILEDGSVTFVL